MDMEAQGFVTRAELWRIEQTLNELSNTQSQHSDRIMRLEQKTPDGARSRNVWGASSPFPGMLVPSHSGKQAGGSLGWASLTETTAESNLNPAAEAFRNFDVEPGPSMMSSLTLEPGDDPRRGASRANSVRFDESANNHYGPSRQSMELPTRTGSGLGGHALSERSLSHRSDGRASAASYIPRTNSFGLDSSRLLGSIHNSPRVSAHPPPGFFALGPCPAIIRCWLTPRFSNDSLLYAVICTGASTSQVSHSLLEKLELSDSVTNDGDSHSIRLPVYLTEAKIQSPAMRSASPVPQIPTLMVKFLVDDHQPVDESIQIIIGSDVLRSHSADVLFSQDKLMIFDSERNQLSIPLVRPEDDAAYKNLCTVSRVRSSSTGPALPPPASPPEQSVGVISRPGRLSASHVVSPTAASSGAAENPPLDPQTDPSTRSSLDLNMTRGAEDSKSTTGSEKSSTNPTKSASGVWGTSWRATSTAQADSKSSNSSSYAKPAATRPMKVLRPSKSLAASRTVSGSTGNVNGSTADSLVKEPDRKGDAEKGQPAARPNPIGSGTAFGWLNTGPGRRTTANGS